jgi:hypothetical protein
MGGGALLPIGLLHPLLFGWPWLLGAVIAAVGCVAMAAGSVLTRQGWRR